VKKEAKILLEKSTQSLILSIELFNRPWDRGRVEAVLILLDHSFELLLKAAILYRGGKIRERRAKQTMGFDTCVRKAFSEGKIKFLTEEQVLQLQAINSLRDSAQHHFIDISEQLLYLHAQAGLTLFKDILKAVFKIDLKTKLPARVLPLSTTPPVDLATLFDNEVKEVHKLLQPGKRRHVEAAAKLRALAIMEGAIQGENLQPTQGELRRLGKAIKSGVSWTDIFPGVASINITAEGLGPSIDLRITKEKGVPVTLVPEGTPGAAVIGIKRVSELDFYNLGRDQLAAKVGLSGNKTTAIIWHANLKVDPECCKEFLIGKSKFTRYSQKAITRIKEELKKGSIDNIWERYCKRNKAAYKK
jgi:hypothetical protein